ncbi:TolC family outer membrane protein [Paraburkholderia sp.]|uniref:TolC family outer membrane protein n=1 Tax=Paraburkholderia sp. TaxID=1926495 RepID=UPI003C76D198
MRARNHAARAGGSLPAPAPTRLRRVCLATSIAVLIGMTAPAHAIGLADAYDAALSADPVYAGALKEKEAGDANIGIGRSYLLPNLSANYSNYRDATGTTFFGSPEGDTSTNQSYRAYSEGITLRQPIINLEGLARYRYGKATALASDATFADHSEELLVRVLAAYTDTVFALDQLAFASAQKKALDEQLASNEAMFSNGEGTRTDILETRSKQALAQADVADAQDNVDNTSHVLETLTGLPATLNVDDLDRLSDNYQPKMISPASYEQWRDIALDNNAELDAERHSVEASHQQLEVVRAGFYPHVDLVGSLGKSQSNSVDTIDQRYLTKSIGVEITIPLYSGGMVSASSAQARANYERMQFELQDKTNKVLLDVRKQYNLCVSSLARIDALQSAVASATLLITATHKSVQAGMRTNLDVLTAEQQLYEAKRDLAHARYQYLLADLQLKHAAGVLRAQDLYEEAQWFLPTNQTVSTAKTSATSLHLP